MALFKKGKAKKFEMLTIRKVADTTTERYVAYDPSTGERKLVNPDTPGDAHEPYPFVGVEIVGTPPQYTSVSQTWVLRGAAEGWLYVENRQDVSRPGGPAGLAWNPAQRHNFIHADSLTIKTLSGDVKYMVTRQPDKYALKGDDVKVSDEIYAKGDTEVSWVFELEREV